MSEAYRTAYIYVRNMFAGTLRETESGYSFAYDEDYLADSNHPPVSLTLPLRTEEYTSKELFPFFDGLIPEGWLLDEVIRSWKLDRHDRFGVLLCACRDPVGCVSVRSEKE